MTIPVPQLLADLPCHTGENPLWHEDERLIYWTDIPNARLYRCRPDGSKLACFEVGEPVGGFTLQADGKLLLFMARGAVKLWQDGVFGDTVVEEIPAERDSRFNDVIADPAGRVFCGTMSSPAHGGRFYRLDLDGRLTLLRENMGTPNGMGFSLDLHTFYQNDSRDSQMYRYRYCQATGELSDCAVHLAVDPEAGQGRPDGMTVDAEGNLWTARWDGACLVHHAADGTPQRVIPFPVKKVSSLTIAGEDGRTAFVTTAGGHLRPADGALAGSLFRLDHLPIPGRPEFRSRIGL